MKRLISLILAGLMLLAAAGCSAGNTPAEENEETAEDGQNPVMNFIGDYSADRANAHVEAEDMDSAKITFTWASSASENTTWEMSGKFDPENLTVEYDNCTKTNTVYKEDGTVESDTTVYENGTGRVIFNGDDLTFVWEDDQENVAKDLVFAFSYGSDNA